LFLKIQQKQSGTGRALSPACGQHWLNSERLLTMAKVLILGGGFGGVVAAERLAQQLGDEHQITLISRSRQFIFYPALVRLAFGKCYPEDVSFDLRHSLINRRVNFVEAEVAHIDPFERKVTIAHGEV